MRHFEVVVIGGGSGGYAAAKTARETREQVAIVDSARELGGLCILRGCMPSKTVIYSAEILHLAQSGKRFGLNIPEAKADMSAIHVRKIRTINEFKKYRQEQLQSDRFTLFRDKARFIGPDSIRLEQSGEQLTADAYIIATGSIVNFPDIPGLDLPGIWTSDDVLELDFLPESIIVLGGGLVACELSQFLRRVGSKVIQIQRSLHLLKQESTEAAEVAMRAFRDEGIELYTDTRVSGIEEAGSGFAVHFNDQDGEHTVRATYLLNALGRRPAVDQLGLEAAGVSLTERGAIRINPFQQSTNPRIYAAGDVCGPFEIVHIAIMQGETAARHATGRPTEPVNLDARTTVVFTDPQVASTGIPIKEAGERGFDLEVASYPFDDHGKSILMEARAGFVRAWADRKTGRLIGAECVGKDAGELIHAAAVAVAMQAKVEDLLKVHWYHPTLSEIWSYPFEDIRDAIRNV